MTLDVVSNSPFFTSKYKAVWKENPVVNQIHLGIFSMHPFKCIFHAFLPKVGVYMYLSSDSG